MARGTQYTRSASGMQINIQLPPLWDMVQPSVWNSRGWTYQEAILANRKLFFTSSQAFFECAVRINHEENLAYPSFNRSTHDKPKYTTSTTSLEYGFLREPEHSFEDRRLRAEWVRSESAWEAHTRHLRRYRERVLRHASDSLNAYAGIIHALYPSEDVFCGLPMPAMDLALLWEPEYTSRIRFKAKMGEASHTMSDPFPSWSWASSSPPSGPSDFRRPFSDHSDFCGTLCLWFRPILQNGSPIELQPISAYSDVIWSRKWSYLRVRASVGLAISAGLVESSTNATPLPAWEDMTFGEFESSLEIRWPKYKDFWTDVFGNSQALPRAQSQVSESLRMCHTPNFLITRTQVARVRLLGESPIALTCST